MARNSRTNPPAGPKPLRRTRGGEDNMSGSQLVFKLQTHRFGDAHGHGPVLVVAENDRLVRGARE